MALNSQQQKILAKVMKLLQMTVENGCTPAEAENAKNRAEAMLNEYNLSKRDIDLSDMIIDKFYPADEDGVGYAKTPNWLRLLLNGVNNVFGCIVVWDRDEDGDMVATQSGRKSDMDVADYCYVVIRDQIFTLTTEYVKNNNLKKNSVQVASFMESCAYTVIKNLEQILNKVPSGKTNSSGTSLTVIQEGLTKMNEARDYLCKTLGVTLRKSSSNVRQNEDGKSAASRVKVNSAMSGGSTSGPAMLSR